MEIKLMEMDVVLFAILKQVGNALVVHQLVKILAMRYVVMD